MTPSRWFADEAARIYRDIGGRADTAESRAARERSRLVEWIRERGGSVTVRDLSRGPRPYRDADVAEAALQGLVDAGMGRWVQDAHDGGTMTRYRLCKLAGLDPSHLHRFQNGTGRFTTDSLDRIGQVLRLRLVQDDE